MSLNIVGPVHCIFCARSPAAFTDYPLGRRKSRQMSVVQRFTLVLAGALCGSLPAEDWSAFRGYSGNGVSDATGVPTKWSADEGVAWKIGLPGRSNGSPIVSAGHVFLVSAESKGRQRRLHCIDADDGTVKWVQTIEFAKEMPTHKTNLFGGTTPAANGERVVVWHGSAGLVCYDFGGNQIWHRELGELRHQWGYGTSPVLHGEKVILHSGPGQSVFVAAFDLNTGDTIWKVAEPVENDGQHNNTDKYMGSWSTPIVTSIGNKSAAVCSLATRVNAYDLANGQIIWTCDGLRGRQGDLAYTSPVIAGDVCVAMGGFKGPAIGFRMAGEGNITDARLWRIDKANPQRIGSGVTVDRYVYIANAGPNTIECINPTTGKSTWKQRASGGDHWGSTIFADGRLYATDQNGTTTVFRPNPEKFEPVAVNRLHDPGNSTPAVADGTIYLRTFAHLYCIR
jgi:outer membrane protein assembly factor BamB